LVHSKPRPCYPREIFRETEWTPGLVWMEVEGGKYLREEILFRLGSLIPVSIRYNDNVIPDPLFSYLFLQI
jgi:hypothetical protein